MQTGVRKETHCQSAMGRRGRGGGTEVGAAFWRGLNAVGAAVWAGGPGGYLRSARVHAATGEGALTCSPTCPRAKRFPWRPLAAVRLAEGAAGVSPRYHHNRRGQVTSGHVRRADKPRGPGDGTSGSPTVCD